MKNKSAERLHQLRTAKGEYMKELAHYLHVSVGTISNYENGVHSPDLDTLQQLARYYGVSADYLLGLTDCPYSVETLNRAIAGDYTVGRFLELLKRLSDEDKAFLVRFLRLLGK